MKKFIQKLLGIDKIIEQQNLTNKYLDSIYQMNIKLYELKKASNNAYHIS